MKSEIRKAYNIKNDINKTLQKYSTDFDKKIYERLLELTADIETKSGRLTITPETYPKIKRIINQIIKDFAASEISSKVSDLIRDFAELDDINLKYLDFLNGDLDFDRVGISSRKKFVIDELTDRLSSPASFQGNVTDDIRRIIVRRVIGGNTRKELIEDLKKATVEKDTGLLGRYLEQVTNDSISQYQGTVNQQIYKDLKMDAISYTGSLIETSRVQCIRWVEDKGGLLLKKEHELDITHGLLSREVQWAKTNGAGYGTPGKPYYLDLTEDNFIVIRGGYGCRHEAIPFIATARSLERNEQLLQAFRTFRESQKAAA